MTTLVEQLQTVLAAQVSGRSFNLVNTTEPPVYPYITFQRIVSTSNNNLAAPSDLQNWRIQVDVFDRGFGSAAVLTEQVQTAILAAFPQSVPLSQFDAYEADVKAFRVSTDYSIWSTS